MFRPWGQLDWVLNLSSARTWQFFGCLGTEQRSIAALLALAERQSLSSHTLLRIEELNSPYVDLATAKLNDRENECRVANLQISPIRYQLLAPIIALDPLFNHHVDASVILDITSLPKRYFFYLLKKFVLSTAVRNLVVTYTLPDSYHPGPLSEDQEPWDALPTFRQPDPDLEAKAHRRLIVNVGFMPDGLIAHLEGPTEERQVDLIVPFPAPVSAVRRSWQSVWALTSAATPEKVRFNEHRICANDLSESFELILSLLAPESNLVSFAPFGPKPISAAMCLYATLTGSPIYYAQPKAYHPDYSIGVAQTNNKPKIYSYWIKHEGANLYELPAGRRSIIG